LVPHGSGGQPALFNLHCFTDLILDDLETLLTTLIEPIVAGLGYELVRVRVSGGQDRIVQVMAENADGLCGHQDCVTISHALSEMLDARDPIPFPYRLEVSSPGIDRPLVRPKDFARWAGFEAKIEMLVPVDGRKRFEGRLDGFADGVATLQTAAGVVLLPLADMKAARLLLTDALLAATRPQQDVMQPQTEDAN
jgi:ribosome maturation factor RimP